MANEHLPNNANDSVAQPIRAQWKLTPVSFGAPHFFNMVNFTITHNGEEQNIQVHKAAACSSSPVFDAAFNSKFSEGETQTYILEDVSLEVFTFLAEYMYTRDVLPQQLKEGNVLDESQAIEETFFLLNLWVLADKFCMPHLQNTTIHKINLVITKGERLYRHWLDYVYAETCEGSALRNLFIALGETCVADRIEEAAEWLPDGYLVALTKALLRRNSFDWDEVDFAEFLVPED